MLIWVGRSIAVALSLALAVAAALCSYAEAARGAALPRAAQVGLLSGGAKESLASALYRISPTKPQWSNITRLSKAALAESALHPRALSLIALGQEAQGKTDAAVRTIALANAISRRAIFTHLWYMTDAAKKGELDRFLRHVDLALRTSPESGSALYPILGRALTHPEAQKGFAKLINENPEWLAAGLTVLAQEAASPTDLARSIQAAGGLPEGDEMRQAERIVLAQLAARSGALATRDFYLSLKDADPRIPRSLAFTAVNTNELRQPMTWQAGSSGNMGAGFVNSDRRGFLALTGSAAPSSSDTLAQKLLFLAPGKYALSARIQIGGTSPARIWAVLSCEPTPARRTEAWRRELRDGVKQTVVIPANCPAQDFAIRFEVGELESGADVIISDLSITPEA